MQIDWSAQEMVPADYRPIENPTFDFEVDGIGCYECDGCKRDFFESDDIGVTTREGCYVCTKEWLQGLDMNVFQFCLRIACCCTFSQKVKLAVYGHVLIF